MKPKNLFVLLTIAAVLLISVTLNVIHNSRMRKAAIAQGQKLFPELEVNNVEKIIITTEDEKIVMAKHDNQWLCESKYNFPANFEKIRTTLITLADLKIGEIRAENASLTEKEIFNTLPPQQENSGKSTGRKVDLFDKDGQTMVSFVLGKTYVKKLQPNAPQEFRFGTSVQGRFIGVGSSVYLVADTLDSIDGANVSWLNTALLFVNGSDIDSMLVKDSDGQTIEMTRPATGGNFTISDVADNEEIDNQAINALSAIFVYLLLSDIVDPDISDETTGLAEPVILQATAKDGKVYILKTGNKVPGKNETYAKLMVAIDHDKLPGKATDAEPGAEGETTDQDTENRETLKPPEKIKDEIDALNAKFSKWIYTIPSRHAHSIRKSLKLRESWVSP